MVKTTHAGRRDPELWDRLVNSQFNGQQPILSGEESLVAARKLYLHAFGRKARKWKWELTSGNRYTWPRRGVFLVNPDKRQRDARGLRAIIHDMSHYCHSRLNPNDSAHSARQARLEARLVKFALDRKWHEGALKTEPKPEVVPEEKPKPDKVVLRYRRMVARRDKYARELARFERLAAKAEREVRQYERRHGERLKEDGR